MNREMKTTLILLLLAFGVRLYAALHTPVIAKDGTVYIQSAAYLAEGNLTAGMRIYPPVYPALIAAGYAITGNADAAAQGVSVVMGALALLPFFALTRSIFGVKIAQVASVLFIFQPILVQHAGDAFSESTYLFFFLAALNAGWKGWENRRGSDFFVFGLCAALAYLTRPEGIGLVVGMAIWIGVGLWRRRAAAAPSFGLKWAFGLVPILLLLTPYLIHIRTTTGEWRINAKRNMVDASGLSGALAPPTDLPEAPAPAPLPYTGFVQAESVAQFAGRYLQTFALLAMRYMEVIHPLLFLFVVYLWMRRKAFSSHPEGEAFLVGFFLLYLGGLSLLYVDGRHLLQLVPLFLPWAAAGLIEVAKRFEGDWGGLLAKLRRPGRSVSAQTLLLGLVLIVLSPKTFASHRADKLSLKEAGHWIGSQRGASRILATDSRIAYYAKGRHLEMGNVEEIDEAVRRHKPDWIVLEGEEIAPLPNSRTIAKVFRSGEGPTAYRVIVYGTGQT